VAVAVAICDEAEEGEEVYVVFELRLVENVLTFTFL
jgi:hypothetical protein